MLHQGQKIAAFGMPQVPGLQQEIYSCVDGYGGVRADRIEVDMECSQIGTVPWLRVWKDGKVFAHFNLAMIESYVPMGTATIGP